MGLLRRACADCTNRSDMLGRVVTGVCAKEVFVLQDTTLTAITVFYLFLFVRWVVSSLVPSRPILRIE